MPLKSANPAQFETTWLFPHCKESLRPDEVALALGLKDPRQVLDLCEAGYFIAVPIGDAPVHQQQRQHRRIARFSVEAWYLNRLEDQGLPLPPIKENPQIAWWREQLRKKESTQEVVKTPDPK